MKDKEEDLVDVLTRLGVDVYKVLGDEVNGRCPVHEKTKGRESTRNSWYLNIDSGLWHCLTGDTRVLTPHGRVRIDSLSEAGTGWLMDGDGNWQFTQVEYFGKQEVLDVVLSRNGIERTIQATDKHRWITRYGDKTTDQLTPGARIPSVFTKPCHHGSPNREAIQAGFVFGDGHRLSAHGKPYACRAEFFNENDLEVAVYFDSPVKRSKDYWRIDPLPLAYKDLPDVLLWNTPSYTYWWLAGYFAADGSCTPGVSTPTMSSAFRDNLEAVYDMCVVLGIRTSEVRSTTRVGIDGIRRPLYQLSFYGGLESEFFLRSDQRNTFEGIDKKYERTGWCVKSVQRTGTIAEVYCAIMPSTGSFVLDGNILTGNCFTCGGRGNLAQLVSELTNDPGELWNIQSHIITTGIRRLSAEEAVYDDHAPAVDWMSYSQFATLPERIVNHRNLDPEVAQRYGVRWDTDKKATVVPIVSPLGELRGWQVKKTDYVRNLPSGVDKHTTLFGIERAFNPFCIVVESPLDVVRFHSVYDGSDYSCLSSFGANMSYEQIVLTHRFDKVILAMDNDNAGRAEHRRLAKQMPGKRWVWRYAPTDPKDIGEMTDRQIMTGLNGIGWG